MNALNFKELELYRAVVENNDNILAIKEIARVIGNPVYIFDSAFSFLLSSYEDNSVNQEIVNKEKNTLLLKEMEQNGPESEVNRLTNTDEVVFLNFAGIDPVMAKRIYDGNNVLGYVGIYGSNKEFEEEDKFLLDVICKIISKDLSIRKYSDKAQTLIFEKILSGKLYDKKEIDQVFNRIGLNKEDYKVVVFRSNEYQSIYTLLTKAYKDLIWAVQKNDVILIIDSDKLRGYDLDEISKMLNEKIECRIAISSRQKTSANLVDAYTQASKLIEIGTLYNPSYKIYYYEDYKTKLILSTIDRNILEEAIDIRIKRIVLHDKSSKTSYMDDLTTFFKANRNINKAAELLFIHKNSMYYRLSKIKELFNVDFNDNEDCFKVEISLRILDYLNKTNTKKEQIAF